MFEIFLHYTEKITQFLIAYRQIIGVVLLNLLLMFGLCWVYMRHIPSFILSVRKCIVLQVWILWITGTTSVGCLSSWSAQRFSPFYIGFSYITCPDRYVPAFDAIVETCICSIKGLFFVLLIYWHEVLFHYVLGCITYNYAMFLFLCALLV